jgi:hypothetical protein
MAPVATYDPALDAAYRATVYYATVPLARNARLALRIGQCHPELDAILRRIGARHWAYLSACNPGSQRLGAVANAVRSTLLIRLTGRHWPGEAIADAGDWPPEASVLLPGTELWRAHSLAVAFGQNAFLFGEIGHPARLIWTAKGRNVADGDRIGPIPRGKA